MGLVMANELSMGRNANWPVGRTLALIGGIIGLVVAGVVLAGAGTGFLVSGMMGSYFGTNVAAIAGTVGGVNVILAILTFINVGLMPRNMRVHGAFCVLWGVIGLFTGFGVWIGALLCIVGGALAYTHAAPGTPSGRRPVV
jgi:hypothetical protein